MDLAAVSPSLMLRGNGEFAEDVDGNRLNRQREVGWASATASATPLKTASSYSAWARSNRSSIMRLMLRRSVLRNV